MESAYLSQCLEIPLSGAALTDLMVSVLARGVSFRFCALGSSMAPLIKDRDLITVAPPAYRPPACGDIAAYRQPASNRLVVHRIVRRRAGSFWLQGDNTPGGLDGPVAPEHILGLVTRIERNSRPIRLGLGPEKIIIALLSRLSLLQPAVRLLHPFKCLLLHQNP